jgi:hypothetical protein
MSQLLVWYKGGGDENFAGHAAPTNGSATSPFDTAIKDLSFAVESVNANREAGETSPVPTSNGLVRLSLVDSKSA